jgi:hypothetical protein
MMDERGAAPSGPDPDLDRAHRELVALVRRLEERMDSAVTPAAIAAIADGIIEVNVRVTAMGRVLLTNRTAEITRRARAVSAAIPEIERAIDDIEDDQALIAGVASLLATVDRAIEVAAIVRR